MDKLEKLQGICRILGIDNNSDINIIDELHNKIFQIKKITEFNATIIQEMIKADIIPPIVLKRSQLSCDLKTLRQQLKILTNRYELFKDQKAKKLTLDNLAKEMLQIQNEIEIKQDELNHL